jgi:purine nucleosidase
MPKPLIIDCDPGVDDAVALLLAFAAKDKFELLGVTTVAGNVNAALTARNARVLRELAGREDVPVFAGAARPVMGAAIAAEHFHGVSGLGTLAFAEPKAPLAPERAVDFIVATLMDAAPYSVSLAVTGPMTNIALALLLEPRIEAGVREIVVMGGAREEGGNITASAEYNIYADPHAAAIVFASGLPIVALGLDATHKIRTTPARMARLRASPKARVLVELLDFAIQVERDQAGREGAPLHDPSVIAYLMAPELFATRPCSIQVETASPLTLGHTAVEFRGVDARSCLLRWAVDADAQGVFDLITQRLA